MGLITEMTEIELVILKTFQQNSSIVHKKKKVVKKKANNLRDL